MLLFLYWHEILCPENLQPGFATLAHQVPVPSSSARWLSEVRCCV